MHETWPLSVISCFFWTKPVGRTHLSAVLWHFLWLVQAWHDKVKVRVHICYWLAECTIWGWLSIIFCLIFQLHVCWFLPCKVIVYYISGSLVVGCFELQAFSQFSHVFDVIFSDQAISILRSIHLSSSSSIFWLLCNFGFLCGPLWD